MMDKITRGVGIFYYSYDATLNDVTKKVCPAIKKHPKTLYEKYKTLLLKHQNF